MKKYLPALALSVSIFALALFALSRAHAWGVPHGRPTKTQTYLVVKIVDESKTNSRNDSKPEMKTEYRVIPTTQFKDEEKRLKDEYAKRRLKWLDEKKTDPTKPMPVRPTIEKIGTPYQTQKGAEEYADKLRDEAEGKDKQNARN